MSRVRVYIGVEREAKWLRYIVRSLPKVPEVGTCVQVATILLPSLITKIKNLKGQGLHPTTLRPPFSAAEPTRLSFPALHT